MSDYVKIYGLQRSGTNYVEWLLSENFHDVVVLVDESGWKHGAIPSEFDPTGRNWSDPNWTDERRHTHAEHRRTRLGQAGLDHIERLFATNRLPLCIVTKDPYSWYCGLSRFRARTGGVSVDDAIKTWNSRYSSWVAHGGQTRSCVVRHGDLLIDLATTLESLGAELGLGRSNHEWRNTEIRMGMRGRPARWVFDRDYYLRREYLNELSEAEVDAISLQVDPVVMDMLGYSIE